MNALKTVAVEVLGYNEDTDTFALRVPCPDQGRDTDDNRIDVDDFDMPASLFAHLVGEFGEPDEFVGKTYTLPSRA